MKIRRDMFKPYTAKHSRLESEFKTMSLEIIAKRRRELTKKNFPSEAWFIKLMNEHGIAGYRRNMPIASRFFGDFVWRSEAIVVEIDGKSHDGKEEYDKKRDAFISSFGIKIFRLNMNDTEGAYKLIDTLKSLGVKVKFGWKAKNH